MDEFVLLGLLMKPCAPISETSSAPGNYFKYEFDSDYQRLQIKYLDHVDQHNLQGIMVSLKIVYSRQNLIRSI